MHSTNRRSGYGTRRAKGSALERSGLVEKIWDDGEAAGRSQGSVGVGDCDAHRQMLSEQIQKVAEILTTMSAPPAVYRPP